MLTHLPGSFHIGQAIKYSRCAPALDNDYFLTTLHFEQLPSGEVHQGYITGFVIIRDIFYYLVFCGLDFELVLSEDIQINGRIPNPEVLRQKTTC